MRIKESKLRRIIRRTILEAGVPNFKDWYAADRAEVAASRNKKSPDAIAEDMISKVFNGEIPGSADYLYKEAETMCQRAGCPDKVDYVAEKVINAVLESGF